MTIAAGLILPIYWNTISLYVVAAAAATTMMQQSKLWPILAIMVGIQMVRIAGQVSKIALILSLSLIQASEPPNQSCLSDTSGEAFTAVGAFVPETLSQEVFD